MFESVSPEMGQKMGKQSRLQDKGFLVLALLMAINTDQALSAPNQAAFMAAYNPIMTLLMAGCLKPAKDAINALVADEVIIFAATNAALIVELDAGLAEEGLS